MDNDSGSGLYFDRSVPEPLLEALEPGGAFHDIVAAVERYPNDPLDLHLRALRPGAGHATLYLGITKILNLKCLEKKDGPRFWIEGQMGKGFRAEVAPFADELAVWGKRQTLEDLDKHSRPRRDDYMRAVIEATRDSAHSTNRYVRKEGPQQAALQRQAGLTLLDREVVISMPGGKKAGAMRSARQAIGAALADLEEEYGGKGWVGTRHADVSSDESRRKSFGEELDALAVGTDGVVQAIEVKDGSDTGGVGWTPAQVAVYLRLTTAWVKQDRRKAIRTLVRMHGQRARIFGAPEAEDLILRPVKVVPVIVIGGVVGGKKADSQNKRMVAVAEALERAEEPLSGLRVFQLIDGKLEERGLGNLR